MVIGSYLKITPNAIIDLNSLEVMIMVYLEFRLTTHYHQ